MPIDPHRLLATRPAETPFRYTRRDTMLHGLGVGLGMDPLDTGQLKFVCDDSLEVFPTMSAVLGWVDLTRDPRFYDPQWGLDANRIVVGEVVVTQIKPLPVEGSGIARMFFAEIVDKGRGNAALLRTRKELLNQGGELLATLDTWLFVRGAGGFGGPGEGGPVPVLMPERPADFTCDLKTPENLALIYRLSLGDRNALHTDPAHAARRLRAADPSRHRQLLDRRPCRAAHGARVRRGPLQVGQGPLRQSGVPRGHAFDPDLDRAGQGLFRYEGP